MDINLQFFRKLTQSSSGFQSEKLELSCLGSLI